MIACAIACYTAPWRIPPDNPDLSDAESEDVVSAETYYFAAKQRLGLLRWSLVDIQSGTRVAS